MAWVFSNLYAYSVHQNIVVDSISDFLQRSDQRTNQQGIEGSPLPIVVTPSLDNWIAIRGASEWFVDLPKIASMLSSISGESVISCELIGNAYALRYFNYKGGKKQEALVTPEIAWNSKTEWGGPMPLYEDVEQIAFDKLIGHQIPAALITLGVSSFGHAEEPTLNLGQAVKIFLDKDKIQTSVFDIYASAYNSNDAPILPQSISTDFILMLFDHRYIEGIPDNKTVDRLLEIEEGWIQRAKRTQGNRDVTLTITYCCGTNQPKLDALLRSRNRNIWKTEKSPRPFWWQFWRHK